MQKSFIAIALALTLTSAFAAYTATNYVAAPVTVAADTDTNFTTTGLLTLASITSGNVYLVSGNVTININTTNTSALSWNLWYRQLNSKTLAASQNYTVTIVAPLAPSFYNNYVYGFGSDNSSGSFNLYAYQIPLTGGTGPARLQLSSNTNNTFNTVTVQGLAQIGNTVYVAYLATSNQVNITSFTVGGTTIGTSFILSTTYSNPGTLSLTWGEALGSSQIFALWQENGSLKDAVINVSKGTVGTVTVIPGWNSSIQQASAPFVTDKTLYGEFFFGPDSTNGSYTNFWLRTTANGTLVRVANYSRATSKFGGLISYGPYIAVLFQDSTAASGINFAYEIWDPSTFNTTILKSRTQYLNINGSSYQVPFKVTSGGYYTLLYNNAPTVNGTISGIQVGLLLGSSYLASVIGFLLTIVAGLLLF
jgi:hypothetical protein